MLARRGQTILEYTIIVGIIVVVLSYMGTGIKRGVQSLVKIAADQVGNQQNADQDFTGVQEGYMQNSTDAAQEFRNKQVTAIGYIPVNAVNGAPAYVSNINVNEETDTQTNTYTNGGFTQTQPG